MARTGNSATVWIGNVLLGAAKIIAGIIFVAAGIITSGLRKSLR
jgi:hypothetical protein